ncbi:MAG: heavy-metal-associated domain-containing protein, partial [Candidatus Saccharibacteria bacterium]|nr:heavy-metal-associated domain-containing protein [Rhodoferax sp.]
MPVHTKHDEQGHDHDHAMPQPLAQGHAGDVCCGSSAVVSAQPKEQLGKPAVGVKGVQTPIRILQMDCPTEEGLLRKKLGGMAGVTGLEFNLMQRVLTVTHAPQQIEPILAAVRSLGFTPEIAKDDTAQDQLTPEPAKPWWPLALAGAAAIASEAVTWAALPNWLAAVLALVAVAACGLTTYKKGWI